ncbi:restriction endonuclease subunit S [[Clostridium] polysaccharolyticum]|uniref:Type I restriction enzyme, S subunit n=1 Tax=[Clostridium] polysaccharolyticum TaxID=29364 RepID=A0A1I0FUY2_9FIRM|nr:restriction endonuclease subunit S [[Clostridium] polysaccharolyticum]SET62114.1 type I restriction enzyme, S subunit [[Clostridium] polysaccharolyticum]
MIKKYSEYVLSPAPWLEELPFHWECKKIGTLFFERKTKVSDKDYQPLSVAKIGVVPQLDTAVKTDAGDNRKLVCVGDFVINSRSDRKGSCGVSQLDGSVSLINIVLTPRSQWNSDYVHYLMRCQPFSEEYYRNGRGIVADLWTTRFSEMKSILLPVPPKDEQDQIVRFLNWKVSSINKLIDVRKKQIDELEEYKEAAITYYITHGLKKTKMCPTEIYWLREVPENWKETKLKYILKKHKREIPENAELLICSNSGEVKKRGDSKLGLVASSVDIYQGVKEGDLLIHGMDTWHGAIAISNYDGMCTPVVHVCTCNQSKRFVEYYLKMMAYTKVYKAISNGVRQNTSDFRSWDKVANLLIAFPEFEEQERIADYLDKIVLSTNKIVAEYEEQLEHLHEMKHRVIYDVVTGKIDVRTVDIPEYEFIKEQYDDENDVEIEEQED